MKKALEDLTPTTTNLGERLALISQVEDTTKLKQSVLLEQIVKLPELLQYLIDEGKLDVAHSLYTKQSSNIDRLIGANVKGISRINNKCMSIINV